MDEKAAFKAKLRSINWGVVPGGYRDTTSESMYDSETLPDFPGKEESLDIRSTLRHQLED